MMHGGGCIRHGGMPMGMPIGRGRDGDAYENADRRRRMPIWMRIGRRRDAYRDAYGKREGRGCP